MTNTPSYRIGGELEISLEQLAAPLTGVMPALSKPYQCWTSTGRSAIYMALQQIIERGGIKQAWLPAYCCPSVTAPFAALGFSVRYYSMGPDLQSPAKLPRALAAGEVFLFIHYFGVRNKAIINWLQSVPGREGAFVLEDCVQASLNTDVGQIGDYAFTSYRKFLPQPDGALLASNWPCDRPLLKADEAIISSRLVGKMLRAHGPDETFLPLFAESENRLDAAVEPAELSWLSGYLMARTDMPAIRQARRDNWQEMCRRLADAGLAGKWLTPLFKASLGAGEVPLGLPVLVQNGQRNDLRDHLRARGIYCPVHWPLTHLADEGEEDFANEHDLSDAMLTLPVDQRLGPRAIAYFVDCIKEFFHS